MLESKDRMIWIDTETFGLNPQTDYLLEVGFKITDLQLNTIDNFEIQIWQPFTYAARLVLCQTIPKDEIVLEMHRKSGLFTDAQEYGVTILEAEHFMNQWLDMHQVNGEDPMCGSSIQFDRGMLEVQFPSIFSRFHYRNIDVSTVKELCRRFAPEIYEKKGEGRESLHRVTPDLEDTLVEFRYYRDAFFWATV